MDSKQKFIGNIQKGIDITYKAVRVCGIKAIEAYKKIETKLIATTVGSAIKANVAFEELVVLTIELSKQAAQMAHRGKLWVDSKVEAKIGKIHFDVHHLVITSGTAVVVFALTFMVTGVNRSKVSAAVLEPQVVTDAIYNKETIKINYGDDTPLKNVISDILADKTGNVNEVRPITLKDGNVGYEMGDYIVSLDKVQGHELKEDILTLSVQNKETYSKEDFKKITVQGSTDAVGFNTDVVSTYKINVQYVDTQAPTLTLSATNVEINDTDSFDANAYVQSIVDNYDGVMQNFTVEGDITQKDEERFEAGDYSLVYKTVDANGNVGTATLQVKVNETEDEKAKEEAAAKERAKEMGVSSAAYGNVSSYEGAGSILSAAYAQLGAGQDCTMLVTNSLRAVGINFHSGPAGYMSLGTVVPTSDAQPGDIIYYANGGAGVPHVAVYAGGGQAVHGGYLGTTRVASAWLGSGYVVIRVQ